MFVPGAEGVDAYRLLTALVVPRPIAWVSTLSGDGVGNLAPHSFFTVACARPPTVQFTSVGAKDTLRNVLATGEFVVSLASLPMLDMVNASSARFEAGVDEAEALGVTMEPSDRFSPHRVADSPASLECTLHSTVELGDVVAITVRSEVLEDGHPAMRHLNPLSRLGRNECGLPPEVVAVDRPRHRADVRSWIRCWRSSSPSSSRRRPPFSPYIRTRPVRGRHRAWRGRDLEHVDAVADQLFDGRGGHDEEDTTVVGETSGVEGGYVVPMDPVEFQGTCS